MIYVTFCFNLCCPAIGRKMKSKIHFREFALLMALLMSIVSFSIDAVLPALGEIGRIFELKK